MYVCMNVCNCFYGDLLCRCRVMQVCNDVEEVFRLVLRSTYMHVHQHSILRQLHRNDLTELTSQSCQNIVVLDYTLT